MARSAGSVLRADGFLHPRLKAFERSKNDPKGALSRYWVTSAARWPFLESGAPRQAQDENSRTTRAARSDHLRRIGDDRCPSTSCFRIGSIPTVESLSIRVDSDVMGGVFTMGPPARAPGKKVACLLSARPTMYDTLTGLLSWSLAAQDDAHFAVSSGLNRAKIGFVAATGMLTFFDAPTRQLLRSFTLSYSVRAAKLRCRIAHLLLANYIGNDSTD